MKIATLTVIIVFLVFASFVLGARIGTEAYAYSDAKFKASLASIYLQYIETGKTDALKSSLETDLDLYLFLHKSGEKNIFIYLFPEMNLGSENEAIAERALVRAATYRKTHPSEFPSKALMESANEEQKQHYKEFTNAVNEVVKQYAK